MEEPVTYGDGRTEIDRIVEVVEAGTPVEVLSTGEQIAAAFLFNRMDWLPSPYRDPIEALDRLGESWREKMIDYRRRHPA